MLTGAAIVGVVSGALWWSSRPAPAVPVEAATTAPTYPDLDPQRARDLEAALASPEPEVVATAMPEDVATSFLSDGGSALLPAGAVVRIDETGLTTTGTGTASVPATVVLPDRQEKWSLLLIRESTEWTVYGTVPR